MSLPAGCPVVRGQRQKKETTHSCRAAVVAGVALGVLVMVSRRPRRRAHPGSQAVRPALASPVPVRVSFQSEPHAPPIPS